MSRNSVIVISITLEYYIIIYLEIYDVIYGLVINVIIKQRFDIKFNTSVLVLFILHLYLFYL
ncbi:hypothetical protein C4157_12520 [Clostridioides difficile]|nr:hypothetical protein DDG61_09560 [Clostridioides difficile]CCL01929.1 Conserved hypothetical protein [Clostridioides difficile E13]CCL06975.1 Conserved hypothetical protein [Clostridioides difficile CD002]AWH81176.1 hypothetical protein DDG63_09285 [Clostridioides difficile]EGT3892769.1 hypothetical protein [Clostridioides difficile]